MSAKLWVQRVAAIAAGGLTFPNMEKKILIYLVWCCIQIILWLQARQEKTLDFFLLVSFQGKAESLILS